MLCCSCQVVERNSRRAASEYVSEELKGRAYRVEPVSPLSEAQLVERLDAVLAAAAAAAGGNSSGISAESDTVLKQILQQVSSSWITFLCCFLCVQSWL